MKKTFIAIIGDYESRVRKPEITKLDMNAIAKAQERGKQEALDLLKKRNK